jgi:hypothetical protein
VNIISCLQGFFFLINVIPTIPVNGLSSHDIISSRKTAHTSSSISVLSFSLSLSQRECMYVSPILTSHKKVVSTTVRDQQQKRLSECAQYT